LIVTKEGEIKKQEGIIANLKAQREAVTEKLEAAKKAKKEWEAKKVAAGDAITAYNV
jgi:hypothetical protein